MRNVGTGEKVVCYLCTTPLSLLLQPPTSQITLGVDACQLASGFALPLLSPPSQHQFTFTSWSSHHLHPLNKHDPLIHSGPQLNWRRAPPCFLAAQTLPLLLILPSQWSVVRQHCLLFRHKSIMGLINMGSYSNIHHFLKMIKTYNLVSLGGN